MSDMGIRDARRPAADPLLQDIADYVLGGAAASEEARSTAFYCLLDTLACGMLALRFPACAKLLGPVVAGAEMPDGARVPGTNYRLDPVQAAFNIGAMVRWLDFNDTWLAAEWGHPFRQPGRHSRGRRLPQPQKYRCRAGTAQRRGRPHRHDPGP